MDPSDSDADPMAALAEEFAARYRRGERPPLTEYTDRYPELADRIRGLFPALVALEQFGSVAGPPGGPTGDIPADVGPAPGRLGDYRLLREVGRGGMGVVYEAEQVSLGRRVALKVLPRGAAADAMRMGRFLREARSAARLHHTNIVPVFEVGHQGEDSYYAMQFIHGQSLEQVIQELRRLRGRPSPGASPLPSPSPPPATTEEYRDGLLPGLARSLLTGRFGADHGEDPTPALPDTDRSVRSGVGPDAPTASSAVLPGGARLPGSGAGRRLGYDRGVARVGQQAAGALAHAHSRGIIHRDIKPANLLLDTAGVVWVADFGLARSGDDGLTGTGDVVGTLRYMAPERFRGEGDERADVYALGLTLYELLTLRPAFEAPDRLALIEAIREREPTRPRAIDRRIPRDLETIVLKAIEKDPRRRYPSAGALAEDLGRFLAGEPIAARRASVLRRAVLWAGRRPAEATLAAVGVVAAVSLVGMATSLWYSDRLGDALYLQQIATAGLSWRDGNYGRLERLLDDCPDPYRELWEWRVLKNQCHPERRLLRGHEAGVYRVAYDADGGRLFTASLDGTVRIWDSATGRPIDTLEGGHTHDIYGLAVSPDGTRCVSASADGIINLWDLETGRATRLDGPGPIPVWDVRFNSDGTRFATAESGGVVRLWDAATGRGVPIDTGTRGDVYRVAFSPDGEYLAFCGAGQPVTLWDLEEGRAEHPFGESEELGEDLLGLAFEPRTGRLLAATGTNGLARVWDLDSGRVIDLVGHVGDVFGIAFSPDGKRLATASGDPGVKVWEVATGRTLLGLSGHAATVFDLAYSPDGTALATGSQDRTARIWDPTRDTTALVLRGHDGPVNAVTFQPGGRLLATAGEDATVTLWDPDADAVRWRPTPLRGHEAPVTSLAFSRVGTLLASADRGGSVWLWDLSSRESRGRRLPLGGRAITGLAFYPDGESLTVALADGVVQVWDSATGQRRDEIDPGHARSVQALAIGAGGRFLATGGEDRTVRLRDMATGESHLLGGHSCWVYGLAFAPDDRTLTSVGGLAPDAPLAGRLASVSGDGEVRVWDVGTGTNLLAIPAHGNYVRAVAFHPDGSRVATGGMDRTVKIWGTSTGAELLTLRGHDAGVLGLAFSPDGGLLASAGAEGVVRIWDARR